MRFLPLVRFFLLLSPTLASPAPSPIPLLIWHGLGDTYDSPGISNLTDLVQSIHPSTYVHAIRLSPDSGTDRSSTFLGSVPAQLSQVCTELKSNGNVTGAGALNAIGFSQGGQFLRGLIETCPGLPPVRTLLTFGSQHNGISQFIAECGTWDLVCRSARSLLNGNKWSAWVQSNVVPAQYFRDPDDLDAYLESSGWLARVNNERPGNRSAVYADRLGSVGRFVMFGFRDDQTAIPKGSAWFWDSVEGWVTERKIWKEDWIGLREIKELEFWEVGGEHMRFEDGFLEEVVKVYLGPKGKKGKLEWEGLEDPSPGKNGAAGDDMEL